jgi:hypothetical protein
MSERIPYLHFTRQGLAKIVGWPDPIGRVFCEETNTRHKRGWLWLPNASCPAHLAIDIGIKDRRKDVHSELYALHLPIVRKAQGAAP